MASVAHGLSRARASRRQSERRRATRCFDSAVGRRALRSSRHAESRRQRQGSRRKASAVRRSRARARRAMSRTLETLTIKAEEIRKGDQSLTDKGSVAWTALNDAGVDSHGAVVVIVEW